MSTATDAAGLVGELVALHYRAVEKSNIAVQDLTWEALDNVADALRHRLFPTLPYRPLHMGRTSELVRLLTALPAGEHDADWLVEDVARMVGARDAALQLVGRVAS